MVWVKRGVGGFSQYPSEGKYRVPQRLEGVTLVGEELIGQNSRSRGFEPRLGIRYSRSLYWWLKAMRLAQGINNLTGLNPLRVVLKGYVKPLNF